MQGYQPSFVLCIHICLVLQEMFCHIKVVIASWKLKSNTCTWKLIQSINHVSVLCKCTLYLLSAKGWSFCHVHPCSSHQHNRQVSSPLVEAKTLDDTTIHTHTHTHTHTIHQTHSHTHTHTHTQYTKHMVTHGHTQYTKHTVTHSHTHTRSHTHGHGHVVLV